MTCECEDQLLAIEAKIESQKQSLEALLNSILNVDTQIRDLLTSMAGGGTKSSLSSSLIDELISNEDRDDNGKIYGVDFLLVENDDVPIMLTNTRQMLQQNGKPIPLTEVTWEALLDWWNETGPDPL